jgi:hypothetical protein
MAETINSDGLLLRFGRSQGVRGSKAGVTTSTTKRNELVLTVDLEGAARTIFSTDRNGDGVADGFSGLDTPIPAGARILSQNAIQLEAPAGGTNFTVGTYSTVTGTVDDADGIRVAAGTDGAQVGTQLSGARYVGITTTGTYTAGIYKIVIEYMIP